MHFIGQFFTVILSLEISFFLLKIFTVILIFPVILWYLLPFCCLKKFFF